MHVLSLLLLLLFMDEHDEDGDFGTIQCMGRHFLELFLSEHVPTLVDHLLSVVIGI